MKASDLLSVTSMLSTSAAELVKSDSCNCYVVDGPDSGYFQHRLFFDFRNIPSDGDNSYTIAPAIVGDIEAFGEEDATSTYLNTEDWNGNWTYLYGPTDSSNNPYPYVYSKQNVYISRNTTDGAEDSTYLTMRAVRRTAFVSASQIITTQADILHASVRARVRVIPNGLSNSSAPSAGVTSINNSVVGSKDSHPVDSGAVVGLFFYQSETQETDIEILTRDNTTQIHYSNQPDYDEVVDQPVTGASTQATLPNDLHYTEWIVHRLDWFDGVVRWWVDDALVLNKTVNAPSNPMALNLNVWSNGDENWSGNMSVGGQVTLGIEWIEMVFNISSDPESASSRNLSAPCSLAVLVGLISMQLVFIGTLSVHF